MGQRSGMTPERLRREGRRVLKPSYDRLCVRNQRSGLEGISPFRLRRYHAQLPGRTEPEAAVVVRGAEQNDQRHFRGISSGEKRVHQGAPDAGALMIRKDAIGSAATVAWLTVTWTSDARARDSEWESHGGVRPDDRDLRPCLTEPTSPASARASAATTVCRALVAKGCTVTKVVALMSMSLDGYVADANDGVTEHTGRPRESDSRHRCKCHASELSRERVGIGVAPDRPADSIASGARRHRCPMERRRD
jgi:hypothetical protein